MDEDKSVNKTKSNVEKTTPTKESGKSGQSEPLVSSGVVGETATVASSPTSPAITKTLSASVPQPPPSVPPPVVKTATEPAPKHQPVPVAAENALSLTANPATIPAISAPTAILPAAGNEKKRKSGPAGAKHQRSRKKRSKREAGAPKLPLTGYVRYMNHRRDALRIEFPEKSAIEHTKIIAEEWNALSEELKKPYLAAAEVDKERYNQQMGEFYKQKQDELRKAEAENGRCNQNNSVQASAGPESSVGVGSVAGNGGANDVGNNAQNGLKTILNSENITGKDNAGILQSAQTIISAMPTIASTMSCTLANIKQQLRRSGEYGIPIFTDEFLEHNKSVDLELRTLRKSNIDYEQQNSVLEKHIENMKFGVEKMETENNELIEKNRLLENYLDKFKKIITQALSGLSIPTEPNGATLENIDKYMMDLYNMATSNSHGPASLNKAKDIIRKLDLQIQL